MGMSEGSEEEDSPSAVQGSQGTCPLACSYKEWVRSGPHDGASKGAPCFGGQIYQSRVQIHARVLHLMFFIVTSRMVPWYMSRAP